MTEERKYALLFAATILCARKLATFETSGPTPAKICAVEEAINFQLANSGPAQSTVRWLLWCNGW